jgi:hypothetical protein
MRSTERFCAVAQFTSSNRVLKPLLSSIWRFVKVFVRMARELRCPSRVAGGRRFITTGRSKMMATQTGRKNEEETLDDTGRRHDSQGRFVSEDDEQGSRGRGGQGGRGRAQSGERDSQGRFASDDSDEDTEEEGNGRGQSRSQGSRSQDGSGGGNRRNGSESRERDSQGRFSSDDEENGEEIRSGGRGQSSGQASSKPGGSGGTRVITRAIRVLNEIETRLHELREELEEERGGSSSGSRSGSRSSSRDDDDGSSGEGRGRVLHPETDRRLKQNRDD